MRTKIVPDYATKVRHVGILELDDFYRWMKRWLKFKGYWQGEKCETLYEEVMLTSGPKNIRIVFKTWKNITPYIVGKINIEYVLIAISTKKIPVDGKEVKVHTGDFEIRLKLIIERTGEKGFLRQLYDDVVNKKIQDHNVQEIQDDFNDLMEEIKTIFNQYA